MLKLSAGAGLQISVKSPSPPLSPASLSGTLEGIFNFIMMRLPGEAPVAKPVSLTT